ncbi:serine/threonine-protein kinase [Gemmatimonas sp.]|uniref:serine/threonine-protein kinase n=1 Tax=Gemmatimonas sp. TaxID=1962908 RepID=UPI003561F6AB
MHQEAPPLAPALRELFDIIRPLGVGGMGAVWLVRDRFLDRSVALKVLRDGQAAPDEQERFLREARTSAKLEHPHIIDVYRADETDGIVWFTMRYIEGESLGDRLLERKTLPVTDTVRVLREAAWGLAYAHARGVVHRDIKPDNILLDRVSGRAVVTDFGIARDHGNEANGLTMDGHVLGSVHYMSPEQASGDVVDGRTDLYALGVVGYRALTGALPFDGSPQSVLVAHVTRQVPSLATAAPHVPASVVAVIERCLRKRPDERYGTADELANALDAAMRDAEAAENTVADAAPGGVLSEPEALAVWQRAAQLQAQAAHRMERTPTLRAPTANEQSSGESGTYRVRDVEAAAVEAGISRQYVALALAERRTQATLAALDTVFTAAPYKLKFNDAVNGHPLDGGILRFTMPRLTTSGLANFFSMFSKTNRFASRLESLELFDLHVTLSARATAERPTCEMVITGDLRTGLRRNLYTDWGMMAFHATIAGTIGTTALAGVVGSAALAAIPGVALGGMAAVGSIIWYKWLYRQVFEKTVVELQDLMAAIERHLAREQLFRAGPEAALTSGR